MANVLQQITLHIDRTLEFDKYCFFQVLALLAGVLLEKQVVVVCPNLVS